MLVLIAFPKCRFLQIIIQGKTVIKTFDSFSSTDLQLLQFGFNSLGMGPLFNWNIEKLVAKTRKNIWHYKECKIAKI